MSDDFARQAATALLERCRAAAVKVAVAESCTGGMVGAALTAIPGASDVFDRGYVTYSNAAKAAMLGVPAALIAAHGAVSEETALAMAAGAMTNSGTGLVIAVTGIAGPSGGSADKPVGLVHMAAIRRGRPPLHERHVFAGDREAVRVATVEAALALLGRALHDGVSA